MKKDLALIQRALDAGATLSLLGRGERKFRRGDITGEIVGKRVRTTHLDANAMGYIWLTGADVAKLAAAAAAVLPSIEKDAEEQAAAEALVQGLAPQHLGESYEFWTLETRQQLPLLLKVSKARLQSTIGLAGQREFRLLPSGAIGEYSRDASATWRAAD